MRLLLALLLSISFLSASEIKEVFDCGGQDIKSALKAAFLVEKSAEDFEKQKKPYHFVMTLHSNCIDAVVTEEAYFNEVDLKIVKNIQEAMKRLLKKHDVDIKACNMALQRNGYSKNEVLEDVEIVPNSVTEVIELQHQGYHLFQF